jgi:hypothetical protein
LLNLLSFRYEACGLDGTFNRGKAMNKLFATFTLIISFSLLAACASNQRVQSGYDSNVDFSEYRTYNFSNQIDIENPELPEFLELQFSEAIERQMLVRGYTKADNPDLLVHITVDVKDKSKAPKGRICPSYGDYQSRGAIQYQPYSFGSSNYQPAGGRRTMCKYTEGSIKVDMIDVELKRTIWTGVSLVRIDENDRNLILARNIINDANIMFKNYPSPLHQQIAGMD